MLREELLKEHKALQTENRMLRAKLGMKSEPLGEDLTDPPRRKMIAFGAKYDGSFRDCAEIAKDVRADLKAALASGHFPASTKFSVRIQRYSMGRSIDVTIKKLPGVPLVQRTVDEYGSRYVLTPAAVEYVERANEILQAYNYDRSDSMTDYYDVNFAGHADLDWEVKDVAEKEVTNAA